MKDILEVELELLNDEGTKSIKTTLKDGKEIILYSPKYVELVERENIQLDNILTELEEWLKEEIDDFKQDGYDNSETRKDSLWLAGVYDQDKRILEKIQELKEKYKWYYYY